jgi:hypothetical protein
MIWSMHKNINHHIFFCGDLIVTLTSLPLAGEAVSDLQVNPNKKHTKLQGTDDQVAAA